VREKWLAREAPHPARANESSVIESPKRKIFGLVVVMLMEK